MTQTPASAQTGRSLLARSLVAVPLAILVPVAVTSALRAVMIVAKILTSDSPYYGPSQVDDGTWPLMYVCMLGIIGVIAFRSKSAVNALKLGGFVSLASLAIGTILIPTFCAVVRDPGGQGWQGLRNSTDENQWAFSLMVGICCFILSFVLSRAGRLKGAKSVPLLVNFEANKKCPFCAELVKAEAIVCKHCKRELPVETAVGASV